MLCSSANNFEHRKQAQQATIAIYLAFGFERITGITNEYNPKQVQLLQKERPDLAEHLNRQSSRR